MVHRRGRQTILTEKMKVLETLVRKLPIIEGGRLRVSVDVEIWSELDDLDVLKKLCVNRFGEDIETIGDYGYQVRNQQVLASVSDGVCIAFLSVPDEMYDFYTAIRREYVVQDDLYGLLMSRLTCIGYDVIDRVMISAFEHGASPYYGGCGDFSMINKFGLYNSYSDAVYCAKVNEAIVPEHKPWYAVGIYVDSLTLRKMIWHLESSQQSSQ